MIQPLKFTTTITGGRAIREWCHKAPESFARRAGLLITAYALKIEKQAKLAVPVRTANLRSSIHTELHIGASRMVGTVGTHIHYAPYVEYGTGLYGPRRRTYEIKPRVKKALAWPVPVAFSLARGGAVGAPLYRSRGTATRLRTITVRQRGTRDVPAAKWKRVVLGKTRGAGRLVRSGELAADRMVRRKVIHPGVHPRPYLVPPFRLLLPYFREDLRQLARLRFPGATAG